MLRKVTFYKHLCLSSNSILHNLFYFTLIHDYTSDNMLRTVLMSQCSAVDLVYHLFDVCRLGCILLFFVLFFFLFFFFFLCCFMRMNAFIRSSHKTYGVFIHPLVRTSTTHLCFFSSSDIKLDSPAGVNTSPFKSANKNSAINSQNKTNF